MVAVDETTLAYLRGRPMAPAGPDWYKAVDYWRTLRSDPGARFDLVIDVDATQLKPHVTWGTSPEMVVPVDDRVPDPDKERDPVRREGMERALQYMGLKPNTPIGDIRVDKVFIGSYQLAHRRPARGGGRRARQAQGLEREVGDGRAGLGPGEEAGRGRGPDRVFRDAVSNGASRAARCAWR